MPVLGVFLVPDAEECKRSGTKFNEVNYTKFQNLASLIFDSDSETLMFLAIVK